MAIAVKRVYDPAGQEDGLRILVDRLWPRGLSRTDARIDRWDRDMAPSTELRRWFNHDPKRWVEFKRRYSVELDEQRLLIETIRGEVARGTATLLFAAKDTEFNNATALREYLTQSTRSSRHRS